MKKTLLSLVCSILLVGSLVAQNPPQVSGTYWGHNTHGQSFNFSVEGRNHVQLYWTYDPYTLQYGTVTQAVLFMSPSIGRIGLPHFGFPRGLSEPNYMWVYPVMVDPIQLNFWGFKLWDMQIAQPRAWRTPSLYFQIMFLYSTGDIGMTRCIEITYQ